MKNFPLYPPPIGVLLVCLFVLASSSPCPTQSGGTRPHEVAVRNGDVIATSLGTNSVRVLRAGTTNVIEVGVGAPSWGVCVVGDSAYVTMPSTDEIAVIDLSGTGTVPPPTYLTVPYGCTEILSDPDGDYLYVANVGVPYSTNPEKEWTHSILKIDRLDPQSRIQFETERQPRALALSPDGERLFVGTVQGALGQQGLGTQVSAGSGFTAPHDGGSVLVHISANGTIDHRIAVGSPVRGLAVLPDAVYASEGSGQYRIYFTHVGEGVQSEDPEHGGRAIPNVISSVLMDSDHEPLERQDAIFAHRPDHEPADPVVDNSDLPAVIPERVVVRPESADEGYAAELWVTHSASGTLGRAWIVPETGAIATSGSQPLTFPVVDAVRQTTFGYVLGELSVDYQKISPADLIRTDDETVAGRRFRSRPRGLAIDSTTGLVVVATEFRSDVVLYDPDVHPFASITPDSVVSIGVPILQYGTGDLGEGNFFTFGEGFDFRENQSPNAAKVNNISCGTCHIDGHIDGKVRLTLRKDDNAPGSEKRMVTAVPSMFDTFHTEWLFFEGLVTTVDRAENCQYCTENKFFTDTIHFKPLTPNSPFAGDASALAAAARGRAWFDAMNCSRCHSPSEQSFLRTLDSNATPVLGPRNSLPRLLSDPTQSFVSSDNASAGGQGAQIPPPDQDLIESSLRNMTVVGTRLSDSAATINPGGNALIRGVNTPSLAGLWDNRPYLHDGRYRSLDEVLASTWLNSELESRAARVWQGAGVPDNLFDLEEFPITASSLPPLRVVSGQLRISGQPVTPLDFQTHAHLDPTDAQTSWVSVRQHLSEQVPSATAYEDLLAFLRTLSSQHDPYPDTDPPVVTDLTVEPGPDNDVILSWNTPQLTVCRVLADNDITSATLDTLSLGTSHAVTLTLPSGGRWTFTVQSAYRGQVASASVQQPLMFTNRSDATGLSVPFGSEPYASAPLDFDDDGAEDLLISFEVRPASLNRNSALGGEAPEFNNVASLQLHDGQLQNTRGIATADFNGDGRVDVFIADANTTTPSNLLLAGSSTGLDSDESARLTAAASLASTGASFGDFDGDGWLDLYVLSHETGSGDLLMHLDSSDTTFVDVTFDAGLRTDMTNSTSVAWADVNLDGRMDLVAGWGAAVGSNGEWSPLYINQGPDTNGQVTFADKADSAGTPWIDTVGHVQAMVFADITGDRKLDLIVATDEPSAANTLLAFVNDGTGTFALADPSLGVQSQLPLGDVAVTDFDGNGVLDILAVPKTQDDVLLLTGHGDADHRVFYDRTTLAGLGSELARGITIADFNRDTDADIFLLREELSADPDPEDKRFFWSNDLVDAVSPPSTPKAITIGFAREPGPNNYNTMGIGARVAVAVTKPGGTVLRSVQVVDGGTGRGSRGSGRLVFGLAGQSTAEITVRWPHGQTQVFDAASVPGFPHLTLTDTSDPEIQSSTVTASYIPSSGYTTHTYSWKSTYPGGYPQVLVTTGNKPTSCLVPLGGVNQLLLTQSTSGVSVNSEFVDGEWLHTVTWITVCAGSCTYTYYVRNVVGGQVYSSTPKILNVSVCADITE